MDGVLIPDHLTTPALAGPDGRPTDGLRRRLAFRKQALDRLRDKIARLRQKNADLRRENAQLKQEAGYWKAMHGREVDREAKLPQELEAARGEIRKLQEKLFGRKSEQAAGRDRSNQLSYLQDQQAGRPSRRRGQRPGRRGPGRCGFDPIRKIRNRWRSKCVPFAA